MKIVVYAIAKNEGFFVDRWMDSMSEADQVVVLGHRLRRRHGGAAAGPGRSGDGGANCPLAV